jgi:hypothetical protein
VLPSVTQIINPLNDFSGIPPDDLARKCELGIQFHKAIDLYLIDDLNFDRLDPDLLKPMSAFVSWWEQVVCRPTIIFVEEPMYHKSLRYAGTADLITETTIYDFKLRPYKGVTDILQLEGYKHMLPPGKRDRWVVCFDLEGNMKMHRAQHPKAWGVFRRLLERYYSELEVSNLIEAWKGLN